MKNCTIIYNPVSGRQKFAKDLPYVIEKIKQRGFTIKVLCTEYENHAIELCATACDEKVDLLVISGGDGTLNECINGIAEKVFIPKIGYIPSGTACDIAGTLHIPKNTKKALDIILNGESFLMDIGKSNDTYFGYVTAIGSYVDISYLTGSRLKRTIGYFAYLLMGIKSFFTIPRIKARITHDNGVIEDAFSLILVVDSKKVAGFIINKYPILDDGELDLIVYKYVPFLNNIIFFISFFFAPKVMPFVTRISTKNVKIQTRNKARWNVDGEAGGKGNQEIKVIKQRIRIFVNDKSHKLFKEKGEKL